MSVMSCQYWSHTVNNGFYVTSRVRVTATLCPGQLNDVAVIEHRTKKAAWFFCLHDPYIERAKKTSHNIYNLSYL